VTQARAARRAPSDCWNAGMLERCNEGTMERNGGTAERRNGGLYSDGREGFAIGNANRVRDTIL
jgi:hypothetical protein